DRGQHLALALRRLVGVPGVAREHVDARAFGRGGRIARDVAAAERQPVEDEARPDLVALEVREVSVAGQPHRSLAAQVSEDGGEVVGEVDELLQPLRQVLLEQPGDEGVEDLLDPLRKARDGEAAEQRLVEEPHAFEDLADAQRERLADAEVVQGEPVAGEIGNGLVRDAGAVAAEVATLAVGAGRAAHRARVLAGERVGVAALARSAGRSFRIAARAARRLADAGDADVARRAARAGIAAAGLTARRIARAHLPRRTLRVGAAGAAALHGDAERDDRTAGRGLRDNLPGAFGVRG